MWVPQLAEHTILLMLTDSAARFDPSVNMAMLPQRLMAII